MVSRSKAQIWDEEKKRWVNIPTRKSDILSPLKKRIEQIGEKVGEKIEEVREQNRAIREVRRKIKQKELEEKALPIAKKYGISIEEAVLYIQSEERRKKAQEARKRLTEQLSEMSKNLSTATALQQQPTTKKKRKPSRQEETFFEEEPFIEEESLFSPEPQRRSFPSYSPPSYSRVGTPTYRRRSHPQRFDRKQRIDSMVNQIVIGRKRSSPTTSTKSTKKKIDEMLKKLI